MSKKKKKKKKHQKADNSEQAILAEIAQKIDAYVDAIQRYCILQGKSAKAVEEAAEVVHNGMKKLKKGKYEDVFNDDVDIDDVLENIKR